MRGEWRSENVFVRETNNECCLELYICGGKNNECCLELYTCEGKNNECCLDLEKGK